MKRLISVFLFLFWLVGGFSQNDGNIVRNSESIWADYTDTTYTDASPLSLTASNKITLFNNADVIRDGFLPDHIDSLYSRSDSTILGKNGRSMLLTIEFKIRPTTASNTKVTVAVDIGGSVGELYPRDFIMTKGNGVTHYYLSSFGAYTLDTWETNGGKVKIEVDAAAELFDLRYVIFVLGG